MSSPKFNVSSGLNSTVLIQCNRAFAARLIKIFEEVVTECSEHSELGHVGHAFILALKKSYETSSPVKNGEM